MSKENLEHESKEGSAESGRFKVGKGLWGRAEEDQIKKGKLFEECVMKATKATTVYNY